MKYNKDNPLRLYEICAGYGSQALALNRLRKNFPEFDYKLVGWCEFDPENKAPIERQPAVIAHNALHPDGVGKNDGDLTKIDWEKVPDFDLLSSSTPCQSISNAGLGHGFVKGSGTRSSIIWNVHDCVRIKRPKYIISENVSAILGAKFFPLLRLWMDELEKFGYVNFMPPSFPTPWNKGKTKAGCLNSKNYGCPQNRERWFLISILRTSDDPNPLYTFPEPFPLETCLADVLEEGVEEKYFLRDEMLSRFCEKSIEEQPIISKGITVKSIKYVHRDAPNMSGGTGYDVIDKFTVELDGGKKITLLVSIWHVPVDTIADRFADALKEALGSAPNNIKDAFFMYVDEIVKNKRCMYSKEDILSTNGHRLGILAY